MGYYYAKKCNAWEVKIRGKYLGSFKSEEAAKLFYEEKCNEIGVPTIQYNNSEFRDISGYNGAYRISKTGEVLSTSGTSARIIKPYIDIHGYYVIRLSKDKNRKKEKLHRLLYNTFIGEIPEDMFVDHIDRDKKNNNLCNLRLLTKSQNNINSDRVECARGCYKRENKWRAVIEVGNKRIYLGCFDTEEEAHQAYLDAKKKHHILPAPPIRR